MDLLLWRHAQALETNDALDDLQRPLTKKGKRQAQLVAAWLKRHLPRDTRVLSSPALRTQQTTQTLSENFAYQICPELAPGASVEDVLHITHWPHIDATVLVVGHQPTLGQVAQRLLGMQAPCPIKKGAVWWLRRRVRNGATQVVLVSVQNPQLP